MERLDEYRALVAIIETGGFTAAAERLGIPRSTLSTVISGLESRVGARLLQRTTRVVMPTEEGLRLAERATTLLEEADSIETMFRRDDAVSGSVRVSMPGRIAHRIVVPVLPAFLASHPRLLVDLRVSDDRLDLVAEGLDLVLRVGLLDNSELVCRRLQPLWNVNCAAPAYLARMGQPRAIEDLGGHVAVAYRRTETGGKVALETGTETTFLPASVIVDSTEAYVAAGVAGLGIISVPRFDVSTLLASGALVEILPSLRPSASDMALLYPSRRHLPARISVTRDWLVRIMDEAISGQAEPLGPDI